MTEINKTITLTMGDRGENHKGMQMIGTSADRGFSKEDLEGCKEKFSKMGCKCELMDFGNDAYLLVVRKGIRKIVKKKKLFNEVDNLNIDKKCRMYGRVVNKLARHNVLFSKESQEPDYENGKGRIIKFDDVPYLKKLKESIGDLIEGGNDLIVEGNYYYDISKCGIGFHGDTERKKVIGCRLGASLDLHFQWYYKNEECDDRIVVNLNDGDMYFMSEKCTGNDWKKRNIKTLRHATGCEKFVK
jgi:hypothetical protein